MLADMQWPKFSQHSAAAKGFYDQTGYKLAWSQEGKPTEQALELISILEAADLKGLDSKDYDGGRWPERLNALQTPSASELGLITFINMTRRWENSSRRLMQQETESRPSL